MTHSTLQELFESARQAPPEVPIDQVVQWLDRVGPLQEPLPDSTNLFTIKKIVLMVSFASVVACVIRLILSSLSAALPDLPPPPAIGDFFLEMPDKRELSPEAVTFPETPPELPPYPNRVYPPNLPHPPAPTMELPSGPVLLEAPIALLPPSVPRSIPVFVSLPGLPIQRVAVPLQRDSIPEALRLDTAFADIHTVDLGSAYSNVFIERHAGDGIRIAIETLVSKGKKDNVRSIRDVYNIQFILDKGVLRAVVNLRPEFQAFGFVVLKRPKVKESRIHLWVPESTDILLKNSFGNVSLSGLNSKLIDMKSSYGNMLVQSTVSGQLNVKTSYGNVDLQGVSGRMAVQTSYGNVSASALTLTDDADIKSSYGNIVLQLTNPMDNLNVQMFTSYGKIQVKPLGIKTADKFIQEGSGIKINIRTSYGDVRIE
jgi:hypothetical protein